MIYGPRNGVLHICPPHTWQPAPFLLGHPIYHRYCISFHFERTSLCWPRFLKMPVMINSGSGAEEASALMSLSYDRYLKAGDLYEGYDPDGGTMG